MAVRRRTSFRTRGARRATDWSLGFRPVALTPVAVGSKLLLGSLTQPGIRGPGTIVRTRGGLYFQTDQEAADEVQIGAVGMMLVTQAALTAGAAAIPGPSIDALNDGWFWWQSLLHAQFVAGGNPTKPGRFIEIDSKAMRKFDDGMALVLMVENASPINVFEIAVDIRILVKGQ